MSIKFKLNNPEDEFCLGIFGHSIMVIETETNEDIDSIDFEEAEFEKKYRLIIGLLIISIEIVW